MPDAAHMFFDACSEGNLEQATTLLKSDPEVLNSIHFMDEEKQETPLIIACKKGHINIVRFLLSNPNLKINNHFHRAFHVACGENQAHIVSLLLSHPDISLTREINTTYGNLTAFQYAWRLKCYEAITQFYIHFLRQNPSYLQKSFKEISKAILAKTNSEMVMTLSGENEDLFLQFKNKEKVSLSPIISAAIQQAQQEAAVHYAALFELLMDESVQTSSQNEGAIRLVAILKQLPFDMQCLIYHRLAQSCKDILTRKSILAQIPDSLWSLSIDKMHRLSEKQEFLARYKAIIEKLPIDPLRQAKQVGEVDDVFTLIGFAKNNKPDNDNSLENKIYHIISEIDLSQKNCFDDALKRISALSQIHLEPEKRTLRSLLPWPKKR